MAARQRLGRPQPGFPRMVYLRLFGFLTFCAISVGITLFAAIHIIDNARASSQDSRQLLSDPGGRAADSGTVGPDPVAAARTLWAGNKEAEKLRLGLVWPEVVSWSPRIVHLHNFLSLEECTELMNLGRPRLQLSTVVDSSTGKSISSSTRTSSGMFLNELHRRMPTVKNIEERIATFTMTPVANGEMLQILRYEPGQFYKAHPDFFSDQVNIRRGGQRVATVLMYLEAAEEGGETHFPLAGGQRASCFCGGKEVKGVCVRPKKGDAVLFWSTKLSGETDQESMHESCPVLKGEKWSCTKWIRQREFV